MDEQNFHHPTHSSILNITQTDYIIEMTEHHQVDLPQHLSDNNDKTS
jgi:hypothetical protein